jgi:hypothetical protein
MEVGPATATWWRHIRLGFSRGQRLVGGLLANAKGADLVDGGRWYRRPDVGLSTASAAGDEPGDPVGDTSVSDLGPLTR